MNIKTIHNLPYINFLRSVTSDCSLLISASNSEKSDSLESVFATGVEAGCREVVGGGREAGVDVGAGVRGTLAGAVDTGVVVTGVTL